MRGNKIILGGIINHKHGIGFKITFPDKEMANHYKDMVRWILLDDKLNVATNRGYFDDKEMK